MHFKLILVISLFFGAFADVKALKCYQCNSVDDADCIKDLTKITSKDCPTDKTYVYCATEKDATTGKITRSCREAEGDNNKCDAPNCRWSKDDNSNNHAICQNCDASNAKCLSLTAADATLNAICEKSDTQCVNIINDKSQLQRSCADADQITKCTQDNKLCALCKTGNCNVGVFPENRRRCLQCPTGSECTNATVDSKPCGIYKENDKCYMFADKADTIVRGCASDTDNTKCGTDSPSANCFTCDTDNCNNRLYQRDQTLRCITCTTEKAESCKWGQPTSEAKNCEKQILFNAKEMCYTQNLNNHTYRGCFYDRETNLDECSAATGCMTCSEGDACNNKDDADFTCIRCRSDSEPKCEHEAKELKGEKCRNVVTNANKGCFEGVWNKVVIRGCLVDADEQAKALCDNTEKSRCTSCKDKDCNVAERSSSNTIHSMSSTILVSALALSFLYRSIGKRQ